MLLYHTASFSTYSSDIQFTWITISNYFGMKRNFKCKDLGTKFWFKYGRFWISRCNSSADKSLYGVFNLNSIVNPEINLLCVLFTDFWEK